MLPHCWPFPHFAPHLNNFSLFFSSSFLLSLRLSRKDGEKSLEGWGGDGKRGKESEPGCFMGVTTEQTHPRKMPTLRFPTIENTQGVDLEIHFSHSANMYYGDESQLITAPTPPNPTLSPLAMPAPLPDPSTSITTPRRFQTLRSPPPPPPRPPSCDPRFALQPPERLWLKQRRAKPFSYSGEEVFNPKRREKERGEKLVLVTSFGWW